MFKDPDPRAFYGVALFLIIMGAGAFAIGLVSWIFNYFANTSFTFPAVKIMGGLVIMALGYILAELELARKK